MNPSFWMILEVLLLKAKQYNNKIICQNFPRHAIFAVSCLILSTQRFFKWVLVSSSQNAWSIDPIIISLSFFPSNLKACWTSKSSLVTVVLKTPGSSVPIDKGWELSNHEASCGCVLSPSKRLPEWHCANSKVITLLVGQHSTGIFFCCRICWRLGGRRRAWPSLSGPKSRMDLASK